MARLPPLDGIIPPSQWLCSLADVELEFAGPLQVKLSSALICLNMGNEELNLKRGHVQEKALLLEPRSHCPCVRTFQGQMWVKWKCDGETLEQWGHQAVLHGSQNRR